MPDTGTAVAGAAAAGAAAGGATTSGDGPESSRHRHRAPQGDAERPDPGSAPPQTSSGVLDKLFGKRLLQAGRHIMSHKSWMKTVPTENCDVLMTFADTTDDHTLLWLLNHIRLGIPELIIQIRHHKHTRVYAFFITATYENLLRGAEEMGLRKAVKPEFGGGTRSFSCEEDYIYENIESELCFFTSQERQSIIKYWLDNLRAKQGEVLHNISFLEGQPIIPELSARGVIQQVFPLHEQRILSQLMKSWVQAVCEKQPLDDICDYFGVKIAMYFAWLGFYTTSMLYPAVIGFVLWMLTESDQVSTENYRLQSAYEKNLIIKMVLFQFVNSYLSLFYIGFYLKDMERLKEMLATLLIIRQFLQNVKEVLQPYLYERHKLGELTLRAVWDLLLSVLLKYARLAAGKAMASPTDQTMPGPGLRGTRPGVGQPERREKKCLNGGCGVPDEEEGAEKDEADSGRFSEGETEEESLIDCGLKLRKVSFIEKVDRKAACSGPPVDSSFLEEGSPTMVEKGMDPASVFEMCDDDDDNDNGIHDVKDSKRLDTFQDYQEMFVQFGYVVLFSSAFPLAAMCALINNIIEIRSDAFKLCTGLQRPFGVRVESIGQWQTAMEAMGLIAIIVNCYLIGQCGQLQRLFPWLSPEMAIISIVILEHFAILLKYIIHVAIPDIPTWVKEEMAKLDYQRREAFKKHERQAQQHYQQLQRRKREEEERQRQAEHMARRERERDDSKGDVSGDHHHDKGHGSKSRSGGGGGSGGSDKPKRPSSLLANNNVMKLKQIIPLQSKFSSGGARSPQSPTGSEPKLPGFLSFKFLKSPENKREGAAASAAAGTASASATATAAPSSSSLSGSSSQERSQSPNKAFNPGKLFNFGKSEGGTSTNGAPLPRSGEASSSQTSERQPSRSDLNGVPDEIPSPGGEGAENGHSSDLDAAGFKI
ncbi:anoctamin-8 [Neolamprologus brichardi]|uniref:anoctamin-8 n=1 Tax=Neolamprologus brichardi TaxID=32507 RepID=UPI00164395AC|nr:anoctamin-8 [Neolamprologus brichardi]